MPQVGRVPLVHIVGEFMYCKFVHCIQILGAGACSVGYSGEISVFIVFNVVGAEGFPVTKSEWILFTT